MVLKLSYASKLVAGSLLLTVFVGCATIIGRSSPEPLNVRSTPDQAVVVITDEGGIKIFEGKTPTILSLEKKKGFFSGKKYNVTLSKDGFKDQSVVVDTKVGGWYLGGNLLFGGLIGWFIVDPATGAMWTLSVNEINANLESFPTPTAPQTLPAPEIPAASPAPAAPATQPVTQTPASTPQTRMLQPNTAVIVLLQDVPEALRAKMVPVSH